MKEFPRLRAVEFRKELQGTTHPCVFACETFEGELAGDFVTKLRSEVRPSGLLFEFFAAHLALHFGISMPDGALVQIDTELPDTLPKANADVAARLTNSVGVNFGTRFLPGYDTWPIGQPVPEELRELALEIIAFDALIENPDRRKERPNLLWRDHEILVIDHEMVFSFVFAVGGLDVKRSERLSFLRNPPFYDSLRGSNCEMPRFAEALSLLSDQFLDKILASVPREFGLHHSGAVAEHLRRARDGATEFQKTLKEVLQ